MLSLQGLISERHYLYLPDRRHLTHTPPTSSAQLVCMGFILMHNYDQLLSDFTQGSQHTNSVICATFGHQQVHCAVSHDDRAIKQQYHANCIVRSQTLQPYLGHWAKPLSHHPNQPNVYRGPWVGWGSYDIQIFTKYSQNQITYTYTLCTNRSLKNQA